MRAARAAWAAAGRASARTVVRVAVRAAGVAVRAAGVAVRAAGVAAIVSLSNGALAYRPLATDDASVNPPGKCQLEAWGVHAQGYDDWHVAPACGIGADLEIGLEYLRFQAGQRDPYALSAQIKTVFPGLKWGDWDFGAKLAAQTARTGSPKGWASESVALLGLASGTLAEDWTAHLNLGVDYRRRDDRTSGIYGAALVWDFIERAFVFVEVYGDSRFGALRSAGARWWIFKDRLGLDATVGKQAGQAGSTFYTLGISYYGFGAFD